LPQKRRTLSSALSQYQQAPFGGKLWRGRAGGALDANATSALTVLLSTLSCIVSTSPPYPAASQKSSSKITSAKYRSHAIPQARELPPRVPQLHFHAEFAPITHRVQSPELPIACREAATQQVVSAAVRA
jgi:hypothetical protein